MTMATIELNKKGVTYLMVGLVLLSLATVSVQAAHPPKANSKDPIVFDLTDGQLFLDTVNLSGTSTSPLRNASWSIVNISGRTPTTLLSGPFLTSVQPVSDDLFSWNLIVDVPDIDCTCFVEISVDDASIRPATSRLIVFLGEHHHRPVFPHEVDSMTAQMASGQPEGSSHAMLLSSDLNLTYPVVAAPVSGAIVSVSALVCPAPNGVCTSTPVNVDVPFTIENNLLTLAIDAGALDLDQGLWQFDFTAKDALLRTTGITRAVLLHDTQPPVIELDLETTVNESEPLHIYATLHDGYLGAMYTMNWYIEHENGERRAPSVDELVSEDHLLINLTEQGVYTLQLSVRDRAGYTAQASETITVLNLRPTARISLDGLVINEMGRLSVDAESVWELNASQSYDNEVVDYLWVIDDDRSVRGTPTLASDQLSQPGVYRIELIVFDDDGATHSTVVELEILGMENMDEQTVPLFTVLFLLGVVAFVLVIRFKSPPPIDLPKWSRSDVPNEGETTTSTRRLDATVEEDEPRG